MTALMKECFILWKKTTIYLLFVFIILIIIPLLLVRGLFWQKDDNQIILQVYNHRQKKIIKMELGKYLRGVLAAEMPAVYHPEALKAQAVAARTYTLKQLPQYGGDGSQKYKGADISTDHLDSQAYFSEKEMKKRWGFISFFYYWARINKAVEETGNEVLLYNGKLIDAVYHANSGGKTEDAKYVWGTSTPYLKSVDSPYDKLQDKNYKASFYFGCKELTDKFGIEIKKPEDIEILQKSESGRILKLRVGKETMDGIMVRNKLNLPSTKLEITHEGDIFTFISYGKGHGVGMSQDGANGFAKKGFNYRQILKHYYQGVEIGNMKNKS